MVQSEEDRQAMNAWKATRSADIRKAIQGELADHLENITSGTKRKQEVESEVGKRVRAEWKTLSKDMQASWRKTPNGDLTDKDVGNCDHGLNVYKFIARGRLRERVRADNPNARAQEIDKLVVSCARDEFKALTPRVRWTLDRAPKVNKAFSVDGRFGPCSEDLKQYLVQAGLQHLLSDADLPSGFDNDGDDVCEEEGVQQFDFLEHCVPPVEELDCPSSPASKVAVKESLVSRI